MKKFASLLIILLCLSSCKYKIKPIEFTDTSVDSQFQADIGISYNVAKENSDTAKQINSVIESQIVKSIPNSENAKNISDALKNFDNEFKSFIKNFPENEQTWTLDIETEVLYKTETIITMGLSIYFDTGGAHGNDNIKFLNFNPETGKLYTNKDLFSDLDGFKSLAKTYFLDHMKNEGSDINEFFFGKDFQLPENIGFNDEGIILLYNIYEIASYNQGYTEFVIPMDKAEGFLK